MKLSEIPENYRKAQGIEDFSVGGIVYTLSRSNFAVGTVEAVIPLVRIKWDNCIYNTSYADHQLEYLYVEDKPRFKVNDRVEWTAYSNLTGTITHITDGFIYVLWGSNKQGLSKGTYSKTLLDTLGIIKEPKVTKEITVDLKVHFNLDTSGIETVLIDCVKATVTNGKYQEAKELCELLVSVQSLGKAQEKRKDDSTEGS